MPYQHPLIGSPRPVVGRRLQRLAKEKAREEAAAAQQQQRLRAGHAALEQERKQDNARAREQMRVLEREKADEAALMKLKLDKLKKLQELALGAVSHNVERQTAMPLPTMGLEPLPASLLDLPPCPSHTHTRIPPRGSNP